jgi:DNA-binding transcriptional ArsR family regulator
MSAPRRSPLADRRTLRARAPVFAALGDETRLSLVAELSSGAPRSITQLTEGTALTRQAISKHLRVLEAAGLVHCARHGRESHFQLETGSLDDARRFLGDIAAQWDQALARLKSFVEDE